MRGDVHVLFHGNVPHEDRAAGVVDSIAESVYAAWRQQTMRDNRCYAVLPTGAVQRLFLPDAVTPQQVEALVAQCGGLRGYVPQLSAGKQYAPTIDVYVIQVEGALPERTLPERPAMPLMPAPQGQETFSPPPSFSPPASGYEYVKPDPNWNAAATWGSGMRAPAATARPAIPVGQTMPPPATAKGPPPAFKTPAPMAQTLPPSAPYTPATTARMAQTTPPVAARAPPAEQTPPPMSKSSPGGTPFRAGANVSYYSGTYKSWIPAVVQKYDAATNTYQLDCKAFAAPEHVRAG